MVASYIFLTSMSLVWTKFWAGGSQEIFWHFLMSRNICCSTLCSSDGRRWWMTFSVKFSMTWLAKPFNCGGRRTMMQSHSCTLVIYPWFISHDLYFYVIIQQSSTVIVHHAWALCNTIWQTRINACFESHQYVRVVPRAERISASAWSCHQKLHMSICIQQKNNILSYIWFIKTLIFTLIALFVKCLWMCDPFASLHRWRLFLTLSACYEPRLNCKKSQKC